MNVTQAVTKSNKVKLMRQRYGRTILESAKSTIIHELFKWLIYTRTLIIRNANMKLPMGNGEKIKPTGSDKNKTSD